MCMYLLITLKLPFNPDLGVILEPLRLSSHLITNSRLFHMPLDLNSNSDMWIDELSTSSIQRTHLPLERAQ